MTKEEKAQFDAAVKTEVEKIIVAHQQQFAQTLQTVMKDALDNVDKTNETLIAARNALAKELDAAKEERAKAEKEGEKMAQTYFEDKQKQFIEAACTELLRNLTLMHLEAGKSVRDIAIWLDVPKDFVENINQLILHKAKYATNMPQRVYLAGNPKLRYVDMGRGGTIYFENQEITFDMWWEMAGGDALVILDIPTEEQWETRTKLPLERRTQTLTFIAEQIVDDQISGNGSFVIGQNVITFYAANKR